MAGIVLEKGKTIYSYGQPMTALHLITNGKVDVSYPGGSYTLGKGDVISICDIIQGIQTGQGIRQDRWRIQRS